MVGSLRSETAYKKATTYRAPASVPAQESWTRDRRDMSLDLAIGAKSASTRKVFSSTFAWLGDRLSTVEINGALSRNNIWAVTGNFYPELGGTPELGRLIGPEDDLKAASPTPVALLAYNFWQRHFWRFSRLIRINNLRGINGLRIPTPPRRHLLVTPLCIFYVPHSLSVCPYPCGKIQHLIAFVQGLARFRLPLERPAA